MEILYSISKFVFFWGVAFIILKVGYEETIKRK
jgi:hypothetical protein